jgi:hypothetical protein
LNELFKFQYSNNLINSYKKQYKLDNKLVNTDIYSFGIFPIITYIEYISLIDRISVNKINVINEKVKLSNTSTNYNI